MYIYEKSGNVHLYIKLEVLQYDPGMLESKAEGKLSKALKTRLRLMNDFCEQVYLACTLQR
jgi:hypothetical protein